MTLWIYASISLPHEMMVGMYVESNQLGIDLDLPMQKVLVSSAHFLGILCSSLNYMLNGSMKCSPTQALLLSDIFYMQHWFVLHEHKFCAWIIQIVSQFIVWKGISTFILCISRSMWASVEFDLSARIYWVFILIILKSSVELDWGVPSKWNGLVSAHLYFFWHTHHLADASSTSPF